MLGLSRRLLYNKPKRTDTTLLAQFYYADVDLCTVAAELDSFDGRKNPARCAALVAQLRQYQDNVLRLIQNMMDEVIKEQRASRDFRIKYPEDLIQDGLAGQLWFGAECLAAGSSILNREVESESMRPLAKSLTKQLDNLRHLLRDQSTRNPLIYTDRIKSAFVKFDQTFADFELSYVSAMVPVKTMKEYDMSQEVTVLFSETVSRALAHGLITGDMLEYYDPELMFTIPRLAIVSGLVFFPQGPLNPDRKSQDISELFRPFQSLLKRIRELLWTLSQEELRYLERLLCNLEKTVENDKAPERTTVPSRCKKGAHTTAHIASSDSSSLFNDISSVQNFHSSGASSPDNSSNNRTSVDDFRIALLDVLADPSAQPSDHGNNNLAQHSLQNDLLLSTEQHQNLPSSGLIVNDVETGVARLVITSREEASAPTDQDSHEQQGVSHARPARRQQSAGSTTAHSSQFVFNLPDTSRTEHTYQEHIDNPDVNGEMERRPARVTLIRTVSDAPANSANDTELDIDSVTDSSTSSENSCSDVECSSSSSRGTSPNMQRRQLLLQPFLKSKSRNLQRKYQNVQELLQKLFVCISGVADQLQSNFACDLRNILKCVFELHTGEECVIAKPAKSECGAPVTSLSNGNQTSLQSPPTWMPDSEMDKCCSCRLPFTLLRRRHHCRNCGLIFCGKCSSNAAPLPNYGYERAVRICNKCYVYRINPFFMDDSTEESYNSASNRQQS